MSVKQPSLPSLPSRSTECLSQSTGRLKENVLPLLMPCTQQEAGKYLTELASFQIGSSKEEAPLPQPLCSCHVTPSLLCNCITCRVCQETFGISQFFIMEHDICWKCFSSLMSFSVSSYHHCDSIPYHCPIGTPKFTVDLFTAPLCLREKSIINAGPQEASDRPAVLNLWVKTPLGVGWLTVVT